MTMTFKRLQPNLDLRLQAGFILTELMIVVAIIGTLSSIGMIGYQSKIRQTQLITIYQDLNQFRMPYQILNDEGEGVTNFSPSGLNMPVQTRYCQFSVTAPNIRGETPNAVVCQIQGLNYLLDENLSLKFDDGTWQCQASARIPRRYLPDGCQ